MAARHREPCLNVIALAHEAGHEKTFTARRRNQHA